MSRGNTNRIFSSSIDEAVKRLNKKISRILGKKNNNLRPNRKVSNFTFSLILFIVTILFWLSTALYYVKDGYNALLIKNGEIVNEVHGMKVGLFYPFPFGQIELFDANASQLIDLDDIGKSTFYTASNKAVKLDVHFSYLINNPKLAFEQVIQNQDNLNEFVANYVYIYTAQSVIKENEFKSVNHTVFANTIRETINKKLSQYGLSIAKLNIYQESGNTIVSQKTNAYSNPLAEQIILEADDYKKNLALDTSAEIEHYNTLHAEYVKNKNAVIEQMYYDTLMVIPESSNNSYKLLDMSLSEFLKQNSTVSMMNNISSNTNGRGRKLDRDFTRQRHFNGAE